ncbi:nucleotidyltransferase domain-containing protein [Halobacteria archaeon AArc-m2/3/4]|uniref:Nucleotidyltransferase domain-containing protein n=1 Tax=Natronoglomus mannanivorans TaxID=2979990 RepID=A0ABT2QK82_9EURY|nr:nucleotidyltransferase domain-containing protein [Halobacteria archaeon AArc-m2/3/4]
MSGSSVDGALEALEDRHGVRVVAARDVGSRAWNLAHADSDYDVVFVFAQRPVEYATLDGPESALEFSRGDYECQGWNVRRFAELVVDSNPTAFEFLHSPLRYREFDPLARLEADVGDSFVPIALYHHYRSLAVRQYRKYLQGRLLESEGGELAYRVLEDRGDEYLVRPASTDADDGDENGSVRSIPKATDDYTEATTDRTVKRHLYVARGVLYAQYVRETHRFPTLDFPQFLEEVSDADRDRDRDKDGDWIDADFLERTRRLAERKRRGEGDAVVGRLFEPEEVLLPEIDPSEHADGGVDRGRVDEFVRETLEGAFDSRCLD